MVSSFAATVQICNMANQFTSITFDLQHLKRLWDTENHIFPLMEMQPRMPVSEHLPPLTCCIMIMKHLVFLNYASAIDICTNTRNCIYLYVGQWQCRPQPYSLNCKLAANGLEFLFSSISWIGVRQSCKTYFIVLSYLSGYRLGGGGALLIYTLYSQPGDYSIGRGHGFELGFGKGLTNFVHVVIQAK